MNDLLIQDQTKLRKRNFNKIVSKAITKEGYNRVRILYAGQNPNNYNTMVVFKVIELLKGKYFLEETVFNPSAKSIQTTLTSLNEKFDRIADPKEKMHEIEFKPNPKIIAGTTYTRQMEENRVFHNRLLTNYASVGFLTTFLVKNYLNKKW